jgi:peptidoglycan/LPS O-acetylase OafA/YrhL
MNRIKSLDGIRGIAIIMVLLSHSSFTFPKSITNNLLFYILSNSHTGVLIFFVISGYLITKLLIIEREKTGTVNIRNFYIRRAFRIFPIFYVYIGVNIILKNTVFHDLIPDYITILFASLYLWNYMHLFPKHQSSGNMWFMGHFWSLSMEEQFYLLYPVTFKKLSIEKLKKVIIPIIIVMPAIRLFTYFIFPNSRGQINMMLHTGGDSILTGCLGAILEQSDKFMLTLKRLWLKTWLIILVAIFVFIIDRYLGEKLGGGYGIVIGKTVMNFSILFLLLWCVHIPSMVHSFLNTKVMMKIGVISYSLYIWQQLFFTSLYNSPVNKFPVNLIVVFVVAFTSYYLIEKPILKLRDKFKVVKIKERIFKVKRLQFAD